MSFENRTKAAMVKNTDPSLTGGFWRKRPYPHIFKSVESNFIDGVYPLKCDVKGTLSGKDIHLHPDVASMNSSQALCINFFKKFFDGSDKEEYLINLLKQSGVRLESYDIKNAVFEFVPDKKENTNFDFYLVMNNGTHISFEVKYTENGFGRPRIGMAEKYHDKWEQIYRDRVSNSRYLNCDEQDFYKNYQINRNIIYAGSNDYVLFLTPKANRSKGIVDGRTYIDTINVQHPNIMNLFLEDLIKNLMDLTCDDAQLHEYYCIFREKYIDVLEI